MSPESLVAHCKGKSVLRLYGDDSVVASSTTVQSTCGIGAKYTRSEMR